MGTPRIAGSEHQLREEIAELQAELDRVRDAALLFPPELASWETAQLGWHAKALWAWLWKRNSYRLGRCDFEHLAACSELGGSKSSVYRWRDNLVQQRLLSVIDPRTVRLHDVTDARPPKHTPAGMRPADRPDPQQELPSLQSNQDDVATSSDRASGHSATCMDESPARRITAAAGQRPRPPGLRAFPDPEPEPDAGPEPGTPERSARKSRGQPPSCANIATHSHSHRETIAAPSLSSSSFKGTKADHGSNIASLPASGTGTGNSEPQRMGGAFQQAANISQVKAAADARWMLEQRCLQIRADLGHPAGLLDAPVLRVAMAIEAGQLPLDVYQKLVHYARKANNPGAHFVVSARREFRRLGLDWPAPQH